MITTETRVSRLSTPLRSALSVSSSRHSIFPAGFQSAYN